MNDTHGHNGGSVKEQIVFIASEKENRFNPGWIHPPSFALHNEFQLEKTRSDGVLDTGMARYLRASLDILAHSLPTTA